MEAALEALKDNGVVTRTDGLTATVYAIGADEYLEAAPTPASFSDSRILQSASWMLGISDGPSPNRLRMSTTTRKCPICTMSGWSAQAAFDRRIPSASTVVSRPGISRKGPSTLSWRPVSFST